MKSEYYSEMFLRIQKHIIIMGGIGSQATPNQQVHKQYLSSLILFQGMPSSQDSDLIGSQAMMLPLLSSLLYLRWLISGHTSEDIV